MLIHMLLSFLLLLKTVQILVEKAIIWNRKNRKFKRSVFIWNSEKILVSLLISLIIEYILPSTFKYMQILIYGYFDQIKIVINNTVCAWLKVWRTKPAINQSINQSINQKQDIINKGKINKSKKLKNKSKSNTF